MENNTKTYNGAMLHGCNKQNKDDIKKFSLDLGMVPEDVLDKATPLLQELNDMLGKYNVYTWFTSGYHMKNITE